MFEDLPECVPSLFARSLIPISLILSPAKHVPHLWASFIHHCLTKQASKHESPSALSGSFSATFLFLPCTCFLPLPFYLKLPLPASVTVPLVIGLEAAAGMHLAFSFLTSF